MKWLVRELKRRPQQWHRRRQACTAPSDTSPFWQCGSARRQCRWPRRWQAGRKTHGNRRRTWHPPHRPDPLKEAKGARATKEREWEQAGLTKDLAGAPSTLATTSSVCSVILGLWDNNEALHGWHGNRVSIKRSNTGGVESLSTLLCKLA